MNNIQLYIDSNFWKIESKELGWVEELGSGRKNIQKYAPLYYSDYTVEILNNEKFVFSITYTHLEGDLTPDLTPKQKQQYELQTQSQTDIQSLYKEIGTRLGLSRDQVGTKLGSSWH